MSASSIMRPADNGVEQYLHAGRRSKIASPFRYRVEPAIREEAPAISPLAMKPLPYCASVSAPSAGHQKSWPQKPWHDKCGDEKHCRHKHRWAGAATPAQRIVTTHPQVPLRKACDVINGTNLLSDDKIRGPIGNPTEIAKLLAAGSLPLTAPRQPSPRRSAPRWPAPRRPALRWPGLQWPGLRPRALGISAFLSRMPHGLGTWLFQRTDAEATWRNWQITERSGGLVRGYRDSRFDVLRQLHDLLAQSGVTLAGTGPSDTGLPDTGAADTGAADTEPSDE